MRQQETWFLSIDPGVLERWGRPLAHILGYDDYLSLGMVDGLPRTGPRW
jgi:hypothetical protein